jgi:hypothetical protein
MPSTGDLTTGERRTFTLYPGQTVTIDPTADGSARVWRLGADGKPTTGATIITVATSYGPYTQNTSFGIECVLAPTSYLVAVYGDEERIAAFVPIIGNDILFATTAGAPTDGTSGTGAGTHGKGSLCVDRTNGKLYINGNTNASPTWKLVTSAA